MTLAALLIIAPDEPTKRTKEADLGFEPFASCTVLSHQLDV